MFSTEKAAISVEIRGLRSCLRLGLGVDVRPLYGTRPAAPPAPPTVQVPYAEPTTWRAAKCTSESQSNPLHLLSRYPTRKSSCKDKQPAGSSEISGTVLRDCAFPVPNSAFMMMNFVFEMTDFGHLPLISSIFPLKSQKPRGKQSPSSQPPSITAGWRRNGWQVHPFLSRNERIPH